MTSASFGTAPLFDVVDGVTQVQMLDEAYRAGFRRFDTAPMYAAGRSEPLLGEFLRGRLGVEVVTTKAGLPAEPRRPLQRIVKGVARRALPGAAVERLRGARDRVGTAPPGRQQAELHSGRFEVAEIRTSVEESLRRLDGRIDRLLMHEIRPLDVTDGLLALLTELRASGDVGEVGVATQNHDTVGVLAAGGEVFSAVNLAVGVLHEPVPLPDHVVTRVGHGLLGPGGSHARRISATLLADPELTERWRSATVGTEFQGDRGVAQAMLADSPRLPVTELLVATTRLENIASAHDLISRREPLPVDVQAVLTDAVRAGRADAAAAADETVRR